MKAATKRKLRTMLGDITEFSINVLFWIVLIVGAPIWIPWWAINRYLSD